MYHHSYPHSNINSKTSLSVDLAAAVWTSSSVLAYASFCSKNVCSNAGLHACVPFDNQIFQFEIILIYMQDEDLFPFGTNHYFANQVLYSEESFESANTLFVPLTRCRPDGRFPTESQTLTEHVKVTSEGEKHFGF